MACNCHFVFLVRCNRPIVFSSVAATHNRNGRAQSCSLQWLMYPSMFCSWAYITMFSHGDGSIQFIWVLQCCEFISVPRLSERPGGIACSSRSAMGTVASHSLGPGGIASLSRFTTITAPAHLLDPGGATSSSRFTASIAAPRLFGWPSGVASSSCFANSPSWTS